MSENFRDDDDIWKSPNFIHEISDNDLKDKLSFNYWYGILVGIVLTTVAYFIGSVLLFTK